MFENESWSCPLVVYNINNNDLYCVVECEKYTLTKTQYEQIKTDCGLGPYFAFFRTFPDSVFRIRGPFQRLEEPFYIVDKVRNIDLTEFQDIADHIERELKISEAKQQIRQACTVTDENKGVNDEETGNIEH